MMMKNTYGFILKTEKDYLNDLTANPENVHSMLRLGDIYMRKKKHSLGIQYYEKAAVKLESLGKTHSSEAIMSLIKLHLLKRILKKS